MTTFDQNAEEYVYYDITNTKSKDYSKIILRWKTTASVNWVNVKVPIIFRKSTSKELLK